MHIAKKRGELANHPRDFIELDARVRKALKRAIADCKLSREEIAEALSAQTGTQINCAKLDHYTAASHAGYRFPAVWVIPFCRITGSDELQRLLLGDKLLKALAVGEAALQALRRDGIPEIE